MVTKTKRNYFKNNFGCLFLILNKTTEKENTKDIWNVNEVGEGEEYDSYDDPRMQPEYEIVFKQKVTTEDIYLQMGNKNQSTASCEDMIVKISLPGVGKITEIDINLFDKFLDCRTQN